MGDDVLHACASQNMLGGEGVQFLCRMFYHPPFMVGRNEGADNPRP